MQACMTGAPQQEDTKSQLDTKRTNQTSVSQVCKETVNSWELQKQDITGKVSRNMEPMMPLMSMEVMHCVKKSEISDHKSTMTSMTAAMKIAIPR
jgi:hypothetical protein